MSDELTLNLATGAPLPWHAEKSIHECYPFVEVEWKIKDASGDIVGSLEPRHKDTSLFPVEARARLWAAAPELLEVCVTALIQLGAPDSDDVEKLQAVYDALYKATHKATGRDIPLEEWGETFPIPWHCEDCGASWQASLTEFPDKAHCPKCQSVHIY